MESPVPLSLQDMCKLYILLRLEEFPVETLTLLPLEIQRKLLRGLSHADLLHLVSTSDLFNGVLKDADLYPYPWTKPHGLLSGTRQRLQDILLHGSKCYLPSLLSLHPWHALDSCSAQFDYWFSDPDVRFAKSYSSLHPTVILDDQYKKVVLPSRSLKYIFWDQGSDHQRYLQLTSSSLAALLEYCHMSTGPVELKIDCYNMFCYSLFWKEYEDLLEGRKKQQVTSCTLGSTVKMDPKIPFMQEYLSTVEILELGTDENPSNSILVGLYKKIVSKVSYVLLYNIISSKQPRLKHLLVYGIPMLISSLLDAVSELLCNTTESFTHCSPFFTYTGTELATPSPAPYLLEGLSVLPRGWKKDHAYDDMTSRIASNIASSTASIVAYQMHNLKCVAVDGLGFCYKYFEITSWPRPRCNVPEYRHLLSTFADLLKQPQVRSVSVGRSPLPEAYELIESFLCTPAAHEQSLTVEGLNDIDDEKEMSDESKQDDEEDESVRKKENQENEDEEGEDVIEGESVNSGRKRSTINTEAETVQSKKIRVGPPLKEKPTRPPLSQSLPETNAQFKSLNLRHSSSSVHAWLFSHSKLKLKKLKVRIQDINLVPGDMDLQVEHIAFSTDTYCSYKPTVSPVHLEKFIISNPALKRIEFIHPISRWAPGLLPALNHCLSKFNQQERSLEELLLNSAQFETVPTELLTHVRDLSQRSGTTLILILSPATDYHPVFPNSSLKEFSALSEEFQGKKIKKIVFMFKARMKSIYRIDSTIRLNHWLELVGISFPERFVNSLSGYLRLIAEEVDFLDTR